MKADLEKGTKVCSRCKEEKPLSEFYPSSTSEDGYRPQCIECAKQSARETVQRRRNERVTKELKEDKSYRKLTIGEKKELLLRIRSDKPLSAYHPRELFEYLQSLGYKIKATFTQELTFG